MAAASAITHLHFSSTGDDKVYRIDAESGTVIADTDVQSADGCAVMIG